MVRVIQLAAACVAVLVATAGQLHAGIINGGFETGNFTSWNTIGVTSIETALFGTPTSEGTYHALMTTGNNSVSASTIETFLGLSAGMLNTLAAINTPTPPPSPTANQGSAIKQTITGVAGDILSFDWNFLTNEPTPVSGGGHPNDFAFWSLTPEQGGTLLADTFHSPFFLSATSFNEETGYVSTQYTLTSAGSFTLGFGVIDVNNASGLSGLLVDNIRITSNGPDSDHDISPVPEPSSLAMFGIGACFVGGIGAARRRQRKQLAS